MKPNSLFNNTQVAFSLKSNQELDRAYYLFKLIASPIIVKTLTYMVSFAFKIKLPIDYIIRKTVFDHFCAGVDENKSIKIVDKLYTKGVSSVLDYSVEGKEIERQFDSTLKMTINTIYIAKDQKSIPFAVFKPTGFGRAALYEKISNKSKLTAVELSEWERVKDRFNSVCSEARDNNIPILIDAEYSSAQEAIDNLVLEMMRLYNREKPIVFNTLQMYRWDRLDYLKKIHGIATQEGFFIGMKLVRGAYLENENLLAKQNNYPTPICETKKMTDENYDAAVEYMINNIEKMSVYIGTHNEESCYKSMELMNKNNVKTADNRVWFSQLYGMSDNISFNLAAAGYNVAKYLPFGPVVDVMPYLIRRAEENTSISKQTGRELSLITTERNRRMSEK